MKSDLLTMEFQFISSAHNEAVKHLVRLRDRRDREREQVTLLEGYRELTRAKEYGMEIVECFFSPEFFLGVNEMPLLQSLADEGVRVRQLAPQLLKKIAYRDRPEGLLAIMKMKNHTLQQMPVVKNGLYLVAETIEKPGNLGSMLRSADAVNASGVIICGHGTDIYNPNVIRASTGALFSVPLAEGSNEDVYDFLQRNKIKVVSATPHAEECYCDVDMTQAVAIIVGAEQTGLTEFWLTRSDINVRIPMLGKIDSLNVASAATIMLYEAARQRDFKD
jgi:TrmH family RNA methyltransferase